ncbi:MAG: glycosyltransferase [Bacteroidetes bacterium]|nr:glycosyltransferase [Bacteroidota bacterium]
MNQPRKKALFLYFELAGSVQACMEQLAASYEVEVHLMRYPVVAVAPFHFKLSENITLYERKDYNNSSLIDLVKKINPDFVFICGWADKGYLGVAKYLKKKIPVVLSLDNPWLGTFKQRIASLMGPLYLPSLFTHCWVPGEPNAKYARKLGFKDSRLLLGMYSADTALFAQYEGSYRLSKKQKFPHRFIFLGRYTELKGIRELWKAFLSLNEQERKDWELWCVGKGELEIEFPNHPAIKKIGFIQPHELAPYLAETGVFILPAHYEHWGVVVHEFAAAGFPLICSTTTSAASAFLHEGKNGFFTQPKNISSVREAIEKIINLNDEELRKMGEESKKLAQNITPKIWAATVWKIIEQK